MEGVYYDFAKQTAANFHDEPWMKEVVQAYQYEPVAINSSTNTSLSPSSSAKRVCAFEDNSAAIIPMANSSFMETFADEDRITNAYAIFNKDESYGLFPKELDEPRLFASTSLSSFTGTQCDAYPCPLQSQDSFGCSVSLQSEASDADLIGDPARRRSFDSGLNRKSSEPRGKSHRSLSFDALTTTTARHLDSEKRRRQQMNEIYNRLEDKTRHLIQGKVSKAKILKCTAFLIRHYRNYLKGMQYSQ